MNVRFRLLLYVAAVGLVAMPARRAAAAPCPASIVELDSSVGPFSTAGASFDSADANTHVTYDRVQCNTTLTSQSGGSASDFVRVVESFDVAGLAPGTPVATTVTFQLDGSVYQNCGAGGCGVEMSATLRSGVDSVTAAASIVGPTPPTTKPFAETLSLPVTLTAGTPVTVEFVLRYATGPGQEDANGTLTGRWSVIGLPAGASAVSCLGTTPVRTRSWGALKAHYR